MMRTNRLPARAVATLWALGAGCLPGLGPCRAASEAVPPEVAGGLDPARLALGGDFTIRYTILDRDIRRPAAEDSKKSPDMMGRPMTVTLSEHGGNFLCQRMTNQPDPATALTGDKKWSEVVLFDGKQSFRHIFAPPPARGSVSEDNFLWDGFDGVELSAMPVFCSRVAAFPLIRSLAPVGDGVYQGDVLDPGNSVGQDISLYDPATLVRVSYAQGKPRITQIIRQDPDGTVSRHMDVTAWALFRGIWIPAKAACTFTSPSVEGKRIPSHVVEWSLLDARATADARRFDRSAYVRAGDTVVFMSKPSGTGQFTLTYHPAGGSLDQQRQAAQEAQRRLAARLPAFSREMRADMTNHGNGEEAGPLLRAAEARASATDRKVFLVFHASWCGPCFLLHRFLADPQVRPIMDAHFVVQDLDIWERQKNGWENPGGAALDKKYGGPNSIPFFAVLDAAGGKLGDSIHRGDNMGMPTQPEDVAFFLRLLKTSAPGLTDAEMATLKARLEWSAAL